MTLRVAVEHRTSYAFDRHVAASPHTIRLRPAPHTRTPILGYSLVVEPAGHFLNWQQDPYGNFAARVVFPDPIDRLEVTVEVVADLTPINPFDFFLEPDAETFPLDYDDALLVDLAPYLRTADDGPLLDELVAGIDRGETKTLDFLVALNQSIRDRVDYEIRLEPGVFTPDETLARASGSCRDSAWLLAQVLRRVGLASRFVSGYLVQLQPDVEAIEGPTGPTADFTDLHAWTEVFLPGAGWVGLDPTSGLLAGEGHIPLAATPAPTGAAPITGATDPCEVTFDWSNEVRRVHESPRSTRPYRPGQWEAIDALGRAVDERLVAGDVRATVGGEPTFVGIDDRDADEWNTAADGVAKRIRAEDLTERLRQRFADGGFVHVGQGKWYPGEPLPRWAKTLYWRADGTPIWPRPELLAGEGGRPVGAAVPADDADDAADTSADTPWRLALVLADLLGVERDLVLPAYEDPLYHLWQEASVPADVDAADVDPARADLDDVGYRRRLAEILSRGLRIPTGFVLPLTWHGTGWATSAWRFRRDRLFLAPGDSPVGYRLPLDRLPVGSDGVDPAPPPDALAPVDDLPEVPAPPTPARVDVPVRTALSVELRSGIVHVFLPPVEDLEAYLSLVRAVHDAADALDQPVRIEGYQPPTDPRLRSLSVTPDPGVVEVNVPPVSTWDEAVELTTELYELARRSRLSAEKFDLDGARVGTGGGNHITIGGATPAESPLLRRPDLLRSMITYWQHHPGLSYLFAGSFIGPTSQAPRVDEARHESLDELELAFDELQRQADESPDGSVQPWIVDRLLRHLLVDITGNTHRAEFCIDKLYPPGYGERRLGVVELRGFEMPPHPEMSLVQQLLLRALVARFWDDPYAGDLVRWGSRLHDQFLLPHFVAADLADVCADLGRHGMSFDPAWLEPFVEFRFPRIGDVTIDGVTIELRRALEPWPVLGEEMTAGGTARAVDSSLERIQVEVVGAVPDRHVVLCNREPLVLHHAGTDGRVVGGVRYRAWNPPSSLHPTIGVQSPLVFDLVDTWSGQVLGGCQYHVTHPGGLAYEHLPVNAEEAAGRRVNRFRDFGHTPASMVQPPRPGFGVSPSAGRRSAFLPIGSGAGPLAGAVRSPKGPGFTLDLRRSR